MAPSNKVNCFKFAKFYFKVIKNECKNIKRAANSWKDHSATGEEPVEYLLELLTREDTYTVEHLVLSVNGKSCAVESEILFEALKSLPDDQRNVILYDFWLELNNKEIADRLRLQYARCTTSDSVRLRKLKHIMKYMDEDAVDPWCMLADKSDSLEDALFAEAERENP